MGSIVEECSFHRPGDSSMPFEWQAICDEGYDTEHRRNVDDAPRAAMAGEINK